MGSHKPADCPLFLIGYRGTGKSTVAQLLAHRLGWEWVDADALLEQRAGRDIRQIFAEDGEKVFRDLEAALLAELSLRERVVVATGGGVIVREDNRRRLREGGTVVWLTGDATTLWQRLQACPTSPKRRPNLTVGGLQEVAELLRVREPWYAECAHVVVNTTGLSPQQVVDTVIDKWTSFSPRPACGERGARHQRIVHDHWLLAADRVHPRRRRR